MWIIIQGKLLKRIFHVLLSSITVPHSPILRLESQRIILQPLEFRVVVQVVLGTMTELLLALVRSVGIVLLIVSIIVPMSHYVVELIVTDFVMILDVPLL